MLRIEVRFPLGVYHALSTESFDRPEWPPNPVRMIGALLAAAHESESLDTGKARELIQKLCEAEPPAIVAPQATDVGDAEADGERTLAAIRGASRWAPRNHELSELRKKGVSPRDLGRERNEVYKGGVAVGDLPIEFRWVGLELEAAELSVLQQLAGDVTFLGTTRSPVTVQVLTDPPAGESEPLWWPAALRSTAATSVRVPKADDIAIFDARHESRKATGKQEVESADYVTPVDVGEAIPYMLSAHQEVLASRFAFDPGYWGDMFILALDADISEVWPKGAASYLVARAFRAALLNSYEKSGGEGEAPPVLRGRGDQPHAAIVPLPYVGSFKRTATARSGKPAKTHTVVADGIIRGFAVVLPSEERLPDVAKQRYQVEQGLKRLTTQSQDGAKAGIQVPQAGRIFVKPLKAGKTPLRTLTRSHYTEVCNVWETATPVVHARRRTSSGPRGLERQIAADCTHVGLPAPVEIEVLEHSALAGGPRRLLPDSAVPEPWRGPLNGPRSHLRLYFDRPIVGPVILGRARHFGVGLCIPNLKLGERWAAEKTAPLVSESAAARDGERKAGA